MCCMWQLQNKQKYDDDDDDDDVQAERVTEWSRRLQVCWCRWFVATWFFIKSPHSAAPIKVFSIKVEFWWHERRCPRVGPVLACCYEQPGATQQFFCSDWRFLLYICELGIMYILWSLITTVSVVLRFFSRDLRVELIWFHCHHQNLRSNFVLTSRCCDASQMVLPIFSAFLCM